MPKRLNTEDVKTIFERYGYTVPDNFVYQNNSTSIRVYDEQENTYKDMTYKKLQYQIKKGRSEMETDPFGGTPFFMNSTPVHIFSNS